MSYLQQVLDEIEAEAIHNSRVAGENADVIDAAYALRDRLMAEEQFDALVCLHYSATPFQISILAPTGQDDMLRIALAGLDIEAIESAGKQMLAPGVYAMFHKTAGWWPLREAA